jgi:hypothetical protein
LEVAPSGGKWWRLKYRFAGKEKRLSLGVYPQMTLKAALESRETCRKSLAEGVDPSENRKAMKSAQTDRGPNSFEVVAREWLAKLIDPMSESHRKRAYARFENDVFPRIVGCPIAEITSKELLEVVRRIEERGATDTAHRTLGSCGQIFCYGVATGLCESDVSRDLRGALAPVVESHFAAATDPERISGILRAMDGYNATLVVGSALLLAPIRF